VGVPSRALFSPDSIAFSGCALLHASRPNHGLAQPKNQKDYTIRMREFFDYYLKGEPAPDWLKDGIPRLKLDEHLKCRQKKTEKIAS
jgi:hypothetical protein